MNSLLEYRWETRLDDKPLTENEFHNLANALIR